MSDDKDSKDMSDMIKDLYELKGRVIDLCQNIGPSSECVNLTSISEALDEQCERLYRTKCALGWNEGEGIVVGVVGGKIPCLHVSFHVILVRHLTHPLTADDLRGILDDASQYITDHDLRPTQLVIRRICEYRVVRADCIYDEGELKTTLFPHLMKSLSIMEDSQ